MWPIELRERCVQRLLGDSPPLVKELSRETGVPEPTLSRWQINARTGIWQVPRESMASRKDKRPARWPPSERLRVVIEAASLSEEELGEFLRREGLHGATLEQWRTDALAGLGGPPAPSARRKVSRRERELQRELHRKEKALAEVAALLVLQKKSRLLFGDDEDDSSDQT